MLTEERLAEIWKMRVRLTEAYPELVGAMTDLQKHIEDLEAALAHVVSVEEIEAAIYQGGEIVNPGESLVAFVRVAAKRIHALQLQPRLERGYAPRERVKVLVDALTAIDIPGLADEDGFLWLHILPEGAPMAAINLGQPGPIVCAAINAWVAQKEAALAQLEAGSGK